MTKSDNTRQKLSTKQKNAIDLIIIGKTDQEIADVIHTSRQTVNGWKNHNEYFAAELNYRRACIWDSQIDRLRLLIPRAVDALSDGLESENERLRVQTAFNILKTVGLYGESLKFSGSTDPERILLRWRQEEQLKLLESLL